MWLLAAEMALTVRCQARIMDAPSLNMLHLPGWTIIDTSGLVEITASPSNVASSPRRSDCGLALTYDNSPVYVRRARIRSRASPRRSSNDVVAMRGQHRRPRPMIPTCSDSDPDAVARSSLGAPSERVYSGGACELTAVNSRPVWHSAGSVIGSCRVL